MRRGSNFPSYSLAEGLQKIPLIICLLVGFLTLVGPVHTYGLPETTPTVTTFEQSTVTKSTEAPKSSKGSNPMPAYVSRWNYGVGFQAERLVYPQLTDYHILMVLDIPQIFKNVKREPRLDCDVHENGKCVVQNACSHILLPDPNVTKIDPKVTKMTCAYINLVLARLKRTSLAISQDLFSVLSDPFQSITDQTAEMNLEAEQYDRGSPKRTKRNVLAAIQALADSALKNEDTRAQQQIYESILKEANGQIDRQEGITHSYNTSSAEFMAEFRRTLEESVIELADVQQVINDLQIVNGQQCTEEALLYLDMTDPINQHICYQASLVSQAVLNLTAEVKRFYNEMLRETVLYLDKRSDRLPPRHRQTRAAEASAEQLLQNNKENIMLTHAIDQLQEQLDRDTKTFRQMDSLHDQLIEDIPYIQMGTLSDSTNTTGHRSKRLAVATGIAILVAGLAVGTAVTATLYGSGSEEEIKQLEQTIKMVADKQWHQQHDIDHLKNKLTHLKDSVISVVKLQSESIDTLETMIKSINTRFSTVTSALHDKIQANSRFITYSVLALTNLMYEMHAMSNQANQYLTAIRALRQGQLTPELIDEANLNSILKQLARHLKKKHPSLQIAEKNVHAHYGRKDLRFWRTDDQFIIAMPIALSPSEEAFRTYKVKLFNLPIHEESDYTTRLREDHDIFGISEDGTKFLEASSQDLIHCRQGKTLRCAEATKLYDSYYPTCLAAIFMDNKKQIRKLCQFQFEKVPIKTDLTLLQDDKALVENADSVIYGCGNKPAVSRPGCKMCAIDLMCGCSTTVTSSKWGTVSIGPRITDCQEQDMQYLVFKPTNLAAIQYMETKKHLWYLAADYMRDGSDPGEKLDIFVDNTTYTIAMNRRYELSMSLQDAIQEAQRKIPIRTIYKNPLASWTLYSAKDLLDMPVLLSIIATGISSLTFLFTCYTFCRAGRTTAFMSGMLRSAHAYHTQPINPKGSESLPQAATTTPFTFMVNPPVPCDYSYHWYWALMVAVLLITIVTYGIYYIIQAYKKKKKQGSCEVFLGVQVERNIIWIHVMDIWLPARYMDLQMPRPPANLTVAGSVCRPILSLTWENAQLIVDDEETIIVFPPRLPLSFSQYRQLLQMLQSQYQLHMRYVYHSNQMIMEQAFDIV